VWVMGGESDQSTLYVCMKMSSWNTLFFAVKTKTILKVLISFKKVFVQQK
jgi:hypothetical protein